MIHGHVPKNQRSSSQALSNAPLGWCSMHAATCQTYAYERCPKKLEAYIIQHDASATLNWSIASRKLHQKKHKVSNHTYQHHIPMEPPLPLKHGSYLSSKAHPAVLSARSWCCFGWDWPHAAATRPGGGAKQRRGKFNWPNKVSPCLSKHKQNIIQQNNQRSSSQALSNAPLGWCSMHAGTCQTYANERCPKKWSLIQYDASSA